MSESEKLSRTMTGEVIKNAKDNTTAVLIARKIKHPVYGKYVARSSKIHINDSQNICKKGDVVLIKECRPFSKTKSWDLVKVLEKAIEQA